MGVMHPCNYPGCMKQFDRKYNLKCHLRIHSNEKPYRCHHKNCTRSFRWKSSLNHHLMSLDHTPVADRRARKARGARRRQEKLAQQHANPVRNPISLNCFDLEPSHVPSYSLHPQNNSYRDLSTSRPHLRHPSRVLHTSRPDLSDVSVSSMPNPAGDVPTSDVHFLNKAQLEISAQLRERAQHPSHQLGQTAYRASQAILDSFQPATAQCPPSCSFMEPKKSQLAFWDAPPIRDRAAMHRYNSQYPIRLQQQPAEKEARSYVEESSAPRDVPTFDRAIQTAVDDYLVASLAAAAQPKVEDSLECSATSNLTFPGVDMTPLFEHEAAQHELHTRPPVSDFNKSTHELVTEAMLEESSPIALMNCPSALDPLF